MPSILFVKRMMPSQFLCTYKAFFTLCHKRRTPVGYFLILCLFIASFSKFVLSCNIYCTNYKFCHLVTQEVLIREPTEFVPIKASQTLSFLCHTNARSRTMVSDARL
jgi:hypothetical protein